MYVNYWIGLWQLQAVSCKAVYDLFTKLIDPATNTGHVVAAPIQKYVRGALVAQSVLHSHVGMLAASVVTAAFFSTAKEKKHCPSLTPVLVGTGFFEHDDEFKVELLSTRTKLGPAEGPLWESHREMLWHPAGVVQKQRALASRMRAKRLNQSQGGAAVMRDTRC